MRSRLVLDSVVLLDVAILEPEEVANEEPFEVRELASQSEVGFTAPLGWTPERRTLDAEDD